MNVRLVNTESAAPTPIKTCDAGGCGFVAINAGLCERHIRALTFTTRVQDALMDFLNTRDAIRPGRVFDKDAVLAGEYFGEALNLLLNVLFPDGVLFDESPIFADITKGGSDRGETRWRVNLSWRLLDEFDDDQIGHGNERV